MFRGRLEEKMQRRESCSASLSGGNQVDGLPPALHWESQASATIDEKWHFDVNLEKIQLGVEIKQFDIKF